MNVTSIQTRGHRSARTRPKVHRAEVVGGNPRPACRPGWSSACAAVTWVETEAAVDCGTCLGGLHVWREQYTGGTR